MIATIVFNFPYQAVRTLAVALALGALLAGAVVATAIVVTAVLPLIVSCCVAAVGVVVAALPAAGCVGLIVAFAYFFKP